MEADWSALCKNLCVSEDVTRDWWDIITRRYSEEWRFYHTSSHIKHLLQLYHQWHERIADLDAVLLAIFFHDVVYDPTAKDNEWQSVILFRKFGLDAKLSDQVIERVSEMILATMSHTVDNASDDLDLYLFLDFDMAILGQDETVYKEYATNIRREYCHFDDEAYSSGRSKVLQSFLKMEQIYHSEDLRDVYELPARMNIQREIETLGISCRNESCKI